MTPDILNPPEAWDAAEEEISLWQEERRKKGVRPWTSSSSL